MVLLDAVPLASVDPSVLQGTGWATSGPSTGVLTDLLNAYTAVIKGGGQKVVELEGDACGALLMLQMLVMIAKFGMSPATIREGMFTFLGAYVWYEIAMNGVAVSEAWMSYMGSVGSLLGGGAVPADVMSNPSKFIVLGFKADDLLMQKCLKFPNPLTAIIALLVYSIAGVFVIIGFAGLGVVAIVVVISSSMNVVIGLMLLPFSIERMTMPIGGRGIGMIVDGGINLAATSMALGVAYGQMSKPLTPNPGFQEAVVVAMGAMAAFVICGGIAFFTKGVGTALGIKRMFG
jgi:hypothetical protein